MIVVPVIDLQGGVIVRGVAGRRAEYRPLESCLVTPVSPRSLARAFVDAFGFRSCYIADLDAIAGQPPNMAAYREIAATGLQLWLDAGVGNVAQARQLLASCFENDLHPHVIVGLESLESIAALSLLCENIGSSLAIFSLDLKGGRPLTSLPAWQNAAPLEIARIVYEAGFRRLILLDLADVGVAGGTATLPLVRCLRERFPTLEIIAGGGVRGKEDLLTLANHGCSAALVASALHQGALSKADVASLVARI